jgi:hypothetical protein
MADQPDSDHDDKKPTQVSTLDVVISVFRAWFGVQTEKNRQTRLRQQ